MIINYYRNNHISCVIKITKIYYIYNFYADRIVLVLKTEAKFVKL